MRPTLLDMSLAVPRNRKRLPQIVDLAAAAKTGLFASHASAVLVFQACVGAAEAEVGTGALVRVFDLEAHCGGLVWGLPGWGGLGC